MYTRNIPGELVIFSDKKQTIWFGAIAKFKRIAPIAPYNFFELVKAPKGNYEPTGPDGGDYCFTPHEIDLLEKKEPLTYQRAIEILNAKI